MITTRPRATRLTSRTSTARVARRRSKDRRRSRPSGCGGPSSMVSEGEAFCPGHVTAFFEVREDPDPRKKGSRGAGLCLSLGVRTVARVRDDSRASIDAIVNGRRQKAEVTQRVAQKVLGGRSCEVKILCETTLPDSQAFGVKAAGEFSPATALA